MINIISRSDLSDSDKYFLMVANVLGITPRYSLYQLGIDNPTTVGLSETTDINSKELVSVPFHTPVMVKRQ